MMVTVLEYGKNNEGCYSGGAHFNGHPILHAVVSRSASSNFWWVLETSLRIARESGLQFYHLAMR